MSLTVSFLVSGSWLTLHLALFGPNQYFPTSDSSKRALDLTLATQRSISIKGRETHSLIRKPRVNGLTHKMGLFVSAPLSSGKQDGDFKSYISKLCFSLILIVAEIVKQSLPASGGLFLGRKPLAFMRSI